MAGLPKRRMSVLIGDPEASQSVLIVRESSCRESLEYGQVALTDAEAVARAADDAKPKSLLRILEGYFDPDCGRIPHVLR